MFVPSNISLINETVLELTIDSDNDNPRDLLFDWNTTYYQQKTMKL